MAKIKITLTGDGLVTIPISIRRASDIRGGDILDVIDKRGKILILPIKPRQFRRSLTGKK